MRADISAAGDHQLKRAWKKILITGSSGAGKSTLARSMGDTLQLEVCTLGLILWNKAGSRVPDDQWRRELERLLQRDSWILEGVDGSRLSAVEMGLAACDAAIFLDMPRTVCFWRALKRVFALGPQKPLPAHLRLVNWIWWYYPSRVKPKLLELFMAQAPYKPVMIIRSQVELARFLASFSETGAGGPC